MLDDNVLISCILIVVFGIPPIVATAAVYDYFGCYPRRWETIGIWWMFFLLCLFIPIGGVAVVYVCVRDETQHRKRQKE